MISQISVGKLSDRCIINVGNMGTKKNQNNEAWHLARTHVRTLNSTQKVLFYLTRVSLTENSKLG